MTPASGVDSGVRPEATKPDALHASGLRLLAALFVLLVPWYSTIRPTNFGGADEWLCIDLVSRGILGVPYAHRPLVFLWNSPLFILSSGSLWAFYVTHALWILLGAWVFALTLRRILPTKPDLAFLSGAITMVWAPEDFLRLDTVLTSGYSGFTTVALLSILLFVKACLDRSWLLLALGAALGALTMRGFEGVLPLLCAAPLLVLFRERRLSKTLVAFGSVWVAALTSLAALTLIDLLGAKGGSYQGQALRLDLDPGRILLRIAEQFAFHLRALFTMDQPDLTAPPALLAAGVVLTTFGWLMSQSAVARPGHRRLLVEAAGLGIVLAALGYLPLMLSRSILGAARTQSLSSPGVGLFLGAVALLIGSVVPVARRLVPLALVAYIAAVGTGRTIGMQREWDKWRSLYPEQRRVLGGLVSVAPRVEAGTFFVLIDGEAHWPLSFPFRHAVRYLYEGMASGQVLGADDFLYPLAITSAGLLSAPWPVIRGPWDEPVKLYRHDELVLVRDSGDSGLSILDEWPVDRLGPLPSGSRYMPRQRIQPLGPEPKVRRILAIPPPAR